MPARAKRLGLRDEASALLTAAGARRVLRELVREFDENDLLTRASAIAFRVLFALIPLALFALALLGFLHLGSVWTDELAPLVKERTSEEAFALVNRNVERILGEKRFLWLTLGLVLAVWFVSGGVRTALAALNDIYEGGREERSLVRRYALSVALAVAVGACLLTATVVVTLGGRVLPGRDFLGGIPLLLGSWGIAIALMVLALGLLIRFGPASHQTVRWASLGTGLVVVAWVATSALFGWYVSSVASYTSVYGNLASIIILLTYLYLSSIVFLAGTQVDALVRKMATGTSSPGAE